MPDIHTGKKHLACLVASILLGCLLIGAQADNHIAPPPACIIQLSDIHISTNVQKYWTQFGDREGDLRVLISSVVPRLHPNAVVITGDLTDSKTAAGAGLQQLEEWRTYRSLLEALEAAGVPEEAVFDVRGNHDVFNIASLRGQHLDLFAQHSATGKRGDGEQRVHTHVLLPRTGDEQNGSIMSLQAWAVASSEKQMLPCPSAILLGIDASHSPTTKNPFNFLGFSSAVLTEQVEAQAVAAAAATAPYCEEQNAPPVISYGHYPLSTIDHRADGSPLWASVGILGAVLHAAKGSIHSMQGVAAILADRATAYISGHLHTLFGDRLHRLHLAPSVEGHMAELESGAWKEDRRFRILIAHGPSIAFMDLQLITPSVLHMQPLLRKAEAQSETWKDFYNRRGWGVTSVDESATVIEHIAMLTWPPDARYFPVTGNVAHQNTSDAGIVRAVVFPLDNTSANASGQAGDVSVELTGWLQDGTQLFFHAAMEAEENSINQKARNDGIQVIPRPRTYVAKPMVTVYCAAHGGSGGMRSSDCLPPAQFIDLQLTVRSSENGSLSTSIRQPAALRCQATGEGRQTCWAAPSEVPAPLDVSLLEWFTLLVNWPVFFHRMFWVVWTLHLVLMLIVPRYLAMKSSLLRHILASPFFRVGPTIAAIAGGGGDYASSGRGQPSLAAVIESRPNGLKVLLHRMMQAVLWPFAALVLCAGVTRVWLPMVAYTFYLVTGPLFLADVMTGHPPAIIFSYGMLGKFHEKEWEGISTPDTLLVSFINLVLCVIPLTLWIACVVGRRVLLARRTAGGSWQLAPIATPLGLISFPQAAAFLAIVMINYRFVYSKSLVMLGPVSLLVSPGMAWAPVMALALVASMTNAVIVAGLPPSPKAE